jgi:NAD(P)-dependent dehydrogenase (short-subunit alcohol dehydrogenase family)
MAQRVLITAGASGIGKEIARTFAANGATVCVCDINAKALDTAAKDIPGLKTIVCDVSKRQDIERMVAASVEALGGLDVLVNNAGISGPTAPVELVDPDQWEVVMAVDVIGTFHVTRRSIPHLKKSAAGSIVVMSSLGGRFGYPNRSAYCTAKMGLIGFAKTLSRELGQYNIRVNAIAPGAVGGRPHRTRSSGPRRRGTQNPGTGDRSRDERTVPQTFRRSQGHCRSGPVPDVGRGKINLRPSPADR